MVRALHPMSDEAREEWLLDVYESSLARLAYETFEHFEEAVERELRELRYAARAHTCRLNAERVELTENINNELPVLLTEHTRQLPSLGSVIRSMRRHLDGESVLARLSQTDVPKLAWTPTPGRTTWAFWSMQPSGNRVIRVNSALKVSPTKVSDDMLEYLIFHEMLHDVLPGEGHDAEFRRLEARWPLADAHDFAFDTLRECYRLPQGKASG